jgi:hypothetical protein
VFATTKGWGRLNDHEKNLQLLKAPKPYDAEETEQNEKLWYYLLGGLKIRVPSLLVF